MSTLGRILALWWILLCIATSATAQVTQTVRDALIAVYYATGGPNWTNNDGWLGPAGTECDWHGVGCDNGDFYALFLSSNNLVGYLPPGISDLDMMFYLILSENQIDSLPPEIGDITSLRWLHLEGNPLTSVPPELGNLVNLEQLRLSNTQLTSLPSTIGALANLEELLLDENQLSSLPSGIGNLTQLTVLHLDGNQLTSLPSTFGNLQSLEYLYASNNMLNTLPAGFESLANLRHLRIDGNQLTSLPQNLGNLSSLSLLSAMDNALTAIPSTVGLLASLQYLDLGDNQILAVPAEIGNASQLGTLRLSNNHLSALPREIGSLPLSVLDVASNRITDFPVEIAGCPVNGTLNVWWNGIHTNDPQLWAWLGQRQSDWWFTQTTPPEAFSPERIWDTSVMTSWWPIEYTIDPGGYEVLYRLSPDGIWNSAGWTASKYVTEFPVTALTPGVTYDLVIRSFTFPHINNSNLVVSSDSEYVTVTTSDRGCVAPFITASGIHPTTLSAPPGMNGYLWSTGETTPSITVDPSAPTWFWVTVFDGICEESASILVDEAALFSDGFESGDTSAWSATVP